MQFLWSGWGLTPFSALLNEAAQGFENSKILTEFMFTLVCDVEASA